MNAKYTKEDLERARIFNYSQNGELNFRKSEALAQLIAETRREAYGRAAKECEAFADESKHCDLEQEYGAGECAKRIRGLK